MKSNILFTKLNFYFFAITVVVFIIFCFSFKEPLINNIPFEYDEPDYVANSILLDHFRNYNRSDKYWTQVISYDQPHLYHFLCGIYLENIYHQPINIILKANGLITNPDNPFLSFGKDGDGKFIGNPVIQKHYLAYDVISKARGLSFYFYILSGITFLSILYFTRIAIFSPFF